MEIPHASSNQSYLMEPPTIQIEYLYSTTNVIHSTRTFPNRIEFFVGINFFFGIWRLGIIVNSLAYAISLHIILSDLSVHVLIIFLWWTDVSKDNDNR